MPTTPRALTGVGIGWRPELALATERYAGLRFAELVAEDFDPDAPLPAPVMHLKARGVALVPHGVSLSLGGAERPDPARLSALARLARAADAPLVSEHIAFVRAGGIESGHLLPVPRTRAALRVLAENVRIAKDALPVPLALENIAALFEWPDAEMDEADFLAEALEATDCALLLDVSNLYANAVNAGRDPAALLDRLPLERIAYCHMGGGMIGEDGLYHDTHAHPVPPGARDLLTELCARIAGPPPGVLLERDDRFPREAELHAELNALAAAVARGTAARG